MNFLPSKIYNNSIDFFWKLETMGWHFIDDYHGERYVPFGNTYFDMDRLKIDEYYFITTIANTSTIKDVYLYTLNKECVECPYVFLDKSSTNVSTPGRKFRLTKNYQKYYPADDTSQVICDLDPDFQQFGIYNIKIENEHLCTIDVIKEPVNIYLTLITLLLINVLGIALIYLICHLWNKWNNKNKSNNHKKEAKTTVSNQSSRILSIDTLRGIIVTLMIVGNYGGGGYQDHIVWNGLKLADTLFPGFLWIMGICIPISLKAAFKKKIPKKHLLLGVFNRSVKLFLLGIFINSGSNIFTIRIFGVLQRLGLCYFIVTTICIFTINPQVFVGPDQKYRSKIMNYIKDILNMWIPWLIGLGILLIHTIVIFTVAAPNCPRGYFGPGGLHKNRKFEHCIGGATGYIDHLILGNHLYQNPTIYDVYEAKPFDPEGIVGCLPTIIQILLGVQAGFILLTFKNHLERIFRWLLWSIGLGIIGGVLCGFSKENGLIPINKNLWSISYVCVTTSLAFFLLAVCYVIIDMKKWWSGKPFLFAGMNAMLLYIGHEMTDGHFPARLYWYSAQIPGDDNWRRTHFVAFLSDIWSSEFWLLIAYYLYKINYFFKI